MERDRAIRYYTDTSVWNQLVHQPGHDDCMARLKRAREDRKTQGPISRRF